jgi:beta-mannosidase
MTAAAPITEVKMLVAAEILRVGQVAASYVPLTLEQSQQLTYRPAELVPAHQLFPELDPAKLDEQEFWYRTSIVGEAVPTGEQIWLELDGLATLAEVFWNGERILQSESMFQQHRCCLTTDWRSENELVIVFRSLTAAVKQKRGKLPTARWKTRMVAEQQLRWFRTTLLGRAPGFAASPTIVGPWREIRVVKQRLFRLDGICWRSRLDSGANVSGSADGIVEIRFDVETLDPSNPLIGGRIRVGGDTAEINQNQACLKVPKVSWWMPHTHAESTVLYSAQLELDFADGSKWIADQRQIGFRSVDWQEPLQLKINGLPIFLRGVIWTPTEPENVRPRLQLLKDAGFNLVRLAGTGTYETDEFHSICDELGLLVWQDLMFANMDYPFADAKFHDLVTAEAKQVLTKIGQHCSTVVVCGNSEIQQQVAMLGLDCGASEFFDQELPKLSANLASDLPYVISAPCGGDLPFRTNEGIANYFGVGAYLRPFQDARLAEVRFASECLAFSNIPEPEAIEKVSLMVGGGISPTHPKWKETVPRDSGAGWDFEDVRDHYLKLLFGVDPMALRYSDLDRYWQLSRMASAEAMSTVFKEWRRAASPCQGGIILQGFDRNLGAGWGIVDGSGQPKAAYWLLKRALTPVAIWFTDEGLNGVDVHIANDRPVGWNGSVHLSLYRSGQQLVMKKSVEIAVPAHHTIRLKAEAMFGQFVDVSWSYRFGPPSYEVAFARLESAGLEQADSYYFPNGYRIQPETTSAVGLTASYRWEGDRCLVTLKAEKVLYGVRVAAKNAMASDNYFALEPGRSREVVLSLSDPLRFRAPVITAVNMDGRLSVVEEKV